MAQHLSHASDAGKREWRPELAGHAGPLVCRFSVAAALVFALYLASLGFYMYVRIVHSLDLGPDAW